MKSPVISFIKELVVVLVTVLILNSFVIASFAVPSGSMEDTIAIGVWMTPRASTSLATVSRPSPLPLTSSRRPGSPWRSR